MPDRPDLFSLSSCARLALDRALGVVLAHPRWVVALVAALVYANTLQNRPVLDDGWVIFDNSLIKSLGNIPAIFGQPYNAALPGQNTGMYRPLTTVSYAVNYAIGGANVLGYHVINIALHVLCCLLVLDLGRLLWSASRAGGLSAVSALEAPPDAAATGPLLGALFFAVHPVHVEAVTAMVGRAELLAALGSLSCLYLTCTRGKARWRYPAGLATLALGVLSKENAAVTPLLFGLIALLLPAAAGLEGRAGRERCGGRVRSPRGWPAWRASASSSGPPPVAGRPQRARPSGSPASRTASFSTP